ncbi:hypothetical protein N9T57_02610, partial [Paracoccaceae bacterium]|nr:hypothetical protein [Paracoccaceae bacterium]
MYINGAKIGYSEANLKVTEINEREVLIFTDIGYLEVMSDDDILVTEFSYEYKFDLIDRQMFDYSEASTEFLYENKDDLIKKNPAEVS